MRLQHLLRFIIATFMLVTLTGAAPLLQSAETVNYTYDDLGRIKTVTYAASGVVVTYSYDAAGNRLAKITSGAPTPPVQDHANIPNLGVGANLLDLSGWPEGTAPAGGANVSSFLTSASYYNEARWQTVEGPSGSGQIVAMEAGQTEADANGGGVNTTNNFILDPTKAYEYTLYFRKHDLSKQNIYFGTRASGTESFVRYAYGSEAKNTNPYFMAWNKTTQAANLDPSKWYKVVGYVLPEGYPALASTSEFGGIYDVETGTRLWNVANYRWSEDRLNNNASARFFTYYDQASQNVFTSYFYQPSVRETNISFTPVVPSISMTHTSANEGLDVAWQINLSAATTVDVKVDYYTSIPATSIAAEASDFTAIPVTTAVIPAGQTSITVTTPTVQDSTYEDAEQLYLNLQNPLRATIAEATEEVRIYNDDAAPSFAVNNVAQAEGVNLTFTITKTGSTENSHSVNYATANSSAVSGSDYVAKSGTLTFTSGQTSQTVTITGVEDTAYENNEIFYVNLSSATGGATISDNQGLGTITNDDGTPTFAISDATAIEGDNILFTLTKTGSTNLTHNISFVTANGTALAGSDYVAKSNTVSFTSGQTSKTVTITGAEDTAFEASETFYVNLSGATNGATISDSQGAGTITNDDAAPSFTINNVTQAEGNNLTFTITKTGGTTVSHNVSYATANNSAVTASDYVAKSGTLTFTSGQTSKTVTITGVEDTVFEYNENFFVNLSAATGGATISDSQGLGTITNDDAAPSFTINNSTKSEGTNLTFTITKTGSTNVSHSVNYATANNSAVTASDYVAKSGTLTFTSGQTSQTVTITGVEDTVFEYNENFFVNLSSASSGATIADSQGLGTITNDDAGPSFAISNATAVEGDNILFTLTKTGSTNLTHNISFVTANGTALAGSDYVTKSNTVSFTSGQTSKTVTITGAEDTAFEASEIFYVNLSGATNGATISDSQGAGTVTNDDAGPSFAINNVTQAEGNNLTFTITKTGGTTVSHSVNYATANNSAVTASDYVAKSGTLTFTSAETSKTVTITGVEDTVFEYNENFFVNLSSATGGATISDSQGLGTITNDDAGPSFTINNVTQAEGNNLTFTITKTGSTSLSHNVNYATANNSAVTASDYVAKSGTLTFTSGQTSKTVTITGVEDTVHENNETFHVNLSAATGGATISDSQGVGTITNDDAGPSFTINNVTKSEGTNITFTISKSGSTAKSHNVTYATANSSAVTSSDYVAKSGTLTFTSGQASKTVTVTGANDNTYEGNESFVVNLSSATSGATISDSQGVGTITDTADAPVFAISNATAAEGNNILFTLTKTGATTKTHNISFSTTNGSALAGSDYVAKSNTVSFTSGQTSKTVTITGVEDTVCTEVNETFTVNLNTPTNGAVIGDGSGLGTITDDDNCLPVANNDSASAFNGMFDGVINVLNNDSDSDGGSLSVISAVRTGGSGFASHSATQVDFFTTSCGTHTISYTISDGQGGTDTATVTVTVSGCGGGGGFLF